MAPEPEPVPDPVMRLEATGGNWQGSYEYYYFETTASDRYLYGLVDKDTTDRLSGSDQYAFEYDPNDGKWYDIGVYEPAKYGQDNTGTNLSSFPTAANIQTLYWYGSDDTLRFQCDNPYYVASNKNEYLTCCDVSCDVCCGSIGVYVMYPLKIQIEISG